MNRIQGLCMLTKYVTYSERCTRKGWLRFENYSESRVRSTHVYTCTPWAMQIPFNIKEDTVIQRVEVSYNQKNEINS